MSQQLMTDVPWIEPYPDALLEGDAQESMTLAFVAGLQGLTPGQRSVIALHDVAGFPPDEVADMLGIAPACVLRILERARTALPAAGAAPPPHSAAERELVERFARAFESGAVDRLAALLADDAILTTPPEPFACRGRAAVLAFLRERCDHRAGRRCRLVATRANTQPAFACYVEDPRAPIAHACGLIVLTLRDERIAAVTRFLDTGLYALFGLPRTL